MENVSCPYCGEKNIVNTEQIENLQKCDKCQKVFIRNKDFKPVYISKPIEEYYVTERNRLVDLIKSYKAKKTIDIIEKEYINYYLDVYEDMLVKLENECGKAVAENIWLTKNL